jgi:phosphate:Na+ symporter
MTDALRIIAGEGLRTILAKLTTNRFSAAFTGAFVTAVLNSSSVTTVLIVGFISAGLMSLQQSVGVIMGANIGSTVTAQLIAFKVTQYALVLITIGFAMMFLSKRDVVRQSGTMLMGLGMIFFGMDVMGIKTEPLRGYDPFIIALQSIHRPALAILASAIFTALVQSSAATTGLVIVMASQGFITLEAGIALALGANIGTCVTAVLAAFGKPREAMQAATAHVLFNVVGVLIWLPFIGVLAAIVRGISPDYPDLVGAARLAAETPREIANAHTLFNVANTLLFLPLTGVFAWIVVRLVPIRPIRVPERARAQFLDDVYLETPPLAIDRLRLEIGHLGEIVLDAVAATSPDATGRAPIDLKTVEAAVRDVSTLDTAILEFARRLSARSLTAREAQQIEDLLAVANYLQSMADTIDLNLGAIAREWRERNIKVSEGTRELFIRFHRLVADTIEDAVRAVRDTDIAAAAAVIAAKADVTDQADALARRLAERLTSDDPERIATYRLESEVIEIFKRLYYFAKRIAKIAARGVEESDLLAATGETDAGADETAHS